MKAMKHLINLLVILILTGFTVGLTYVTIEYGSSQSPWAILYLPIFIMMICWGIKITNDYGRYD